MFEKMTLTIIISFISLCIIRRWQRMRTFIYLGIPGPEPHIITGNIGELTMLGYDECLMKWRKEYGDIFGYWMGGNPVLAISDPEIIKHIMIKDFHNFNERPVPNLAYLKIPPSIIVAEEKIWRKNRQTVAASMTVERIKKMIPLLKSENAVLMDKLAQQSFMDVEFDINEYIRQLALDSVGIIFGMETSSQKGNNKPLLRASKKMYQITFTPSYIKYFIDCFPEMNFLFKLLIRLIDRLASFARIPLPSTIYLEEAKLIMRKRLKCPQTSDPDLLQLLIDAEKKDKEMKIPSLTTGPKKTETAVRLTLESVESNIFSMLLAGYMATSGTLGYLTFVIIKRPDIQEKLRTEIENVILEKGDLDFNSIKQLVYMEQVIWEASRTVKPATQLLTRKTSEDISYGDIKIPKGMTVQVSVANLNQSEDFWDDPEVFRPERFSPENRSKLNPMVFQPFGRGPKSCVAMRFGLLQVKLALATILSKYRLVAANETADMKMSFIPPDSVIVKAEKL